MKHRGMPTVAARHRRPLGIDIFWDVDPLAQATCRNSGKRRCVGACPRHRPRHYAIFWAKHKSVLVPVIRPRDREAYLL